MAVNAGPPRAVPSPPPAKTVNIAGRKVKPEYLVYGLAAGAAVVVVVKRKGAGTSTSSGKTTTLVGAGGAGTLNTTSTDLMGIQDSLSRQISDGFGRLLEDSRSDPLTTADPVTGSPSDPVFTTPESSVGIVSITPAAGPVISSPTTTPASSPPAATVASAAPTASPSSTASPGAVSAVLPSGETDPAFIEKITAAQVAQQPAGTAQSNVDFLAHLDDSAPWGQWHTDGYY